MITEKEFKERCAEILRKEITFSHQVGDYVIHGALDSLWKLHIEQNSHKHGVSGKRITEIIHKAVDKTYETIDGYVNEYVDSTHNSMMYDINSLKDELSAACASGAVDKTVSEGNALQKFLKEEKEIEKRDGKIFDE